MFRMAVDRLEPLFPPERILVIANEELTQLLKVQAPHLPPENFIIEPFGRDTAPAVGLAAVHVHQRDPNAIMAILTADHYIQNESMFREVLKAACEVAGGGDIVTLGITPDHPATGFGYIQQGGQHSTFGEVTAYDLERFVEKPDEARARHFLQEGTYCWNSGMFIWQTARVLSELKTYAPSLYARLADIQSALEGDQSEYKATLHDVWGTIEKNSIDYALMEHIHENIRVIPVAMGWADIGNFDALYTIISGGNGDNVTRGKTPTVVDTNGTLIFSDRMVVTIGLEDVVIIDTEDTLLVCNRNRAQDVKRIVEMLRSEEQTEYL
jgi:mannose-1-phosphate guanylyltransferase